MTKVYVSDRKPTVEAAAKFNWQAADESEWLRDAGWCVAAVIWGAVLMRIALVLL